MALEIEKKFLLPPCKATRYVEHLGVQWTKERIKQFYTPSQRLRKKGKNYYATVKSGQGLVRTETESVISKEQFAAQLCHKEGNLLTKFRYTFRYKGQRYELDEFRGALRGLVYLEIEFPDIEAAKRYEAPRKIRSWIIDDVTEKPQFTNRALALHGLPVLDVCVQDALKQMDTFLSASLQLRLHPFADICGVLRAWTAVMKRIIAANREAILANEGDRERLHQLRVALRKLRAVLGLMHQTVGIEEARPITAIAKEIMRRTNAARDLDVALEWMEEYKKLLPPVLAGSLESLRMALERKRQEAYEALRGELASDKFEALLQALQGLSQKEQKCAMPAIFVAKELLEHQSEAVLKKAKRLDKKAEAKRYHLVRIKIKKLRYMVEFFGFVFRDESYKKFLKELKKFQDILGTHQDMMVQVAYIASLLQDAEGQEREALRYLQRVLLQRAAKMRKRFRKRSHRLRELRRHIKKSLCRIA